MAGAVGVRDGKLNFAEAATLILQYQASSGNDDVLVGFLDGSGSITPMDGGRVGHTEEEFIKLAEKISDPARREEVLKKLR